LSRISYENSDKNIKDYVLGPGLVPPNRVGVTLLPRLRMETDLAPEYGVLFLTRDDKVHIVRDSIL
jgi:hypothetical protein